MSDRHAPGGHAAAYPPPETAVADPPRLDYGSLLHRVPAILYIADTGACGRWHYVSPQIEAILGFTAEDWCADPGMWAARLHPDDVDRVLDQEAELTDAEARGSATEYRLLHRDGHPVWVRDDALLLQSEDGVVRWHGVMSDVSIEKEAQAELEVRAAQQAAVARLGELALEGASPTDVMHEAVIAATDLLGMEIGGVLEILADDNALVLRIAHGMPPGSLDEIVPSGARSQAGYALATGTPAIVADWETETRFRCSPALRACHARSGLAVVIEGRRGPFGVLALHATRPRTLKPSDIDFVQALANVLGDVVERQLTDDDIRHRALHHPLTGLPNRVLFMDRLEQAIERARRHPGSLTAVLTLDLDRFKLVNDSLGHAAGDELLAAIGPRLRGAVRPSDTVAHFVGDEFGILLDDIGGEREATDMADRVAQAFAEPFVLDGTEHYVTTSVGIALTTGTASAEDLVRDSNAAVHRAKERGGARWELFDEAMRGRTILRLRVENDLRRAVERDELTLEYQPLVSLPELSLVGVEALVRWDHPDRGRIPPADFIPVAEENGLIDSIGRWVLDRACRQAAQWAGLDPDGPPRTVGVNLSAAQLDDRHLPETVAAALRDSGLEPACLTLELTESVLARDLEELAGSLQALKELGVRLVLDDFGTGYSSLSYLTRLPLDVLKIDRSFIRGLGVEPRDTAITEAVVAMSRALSLEVVGEGVETACQLAELSRLGCDVAQGYYLSRPVPTDALTAMLVDGLPWARGCP